MPRDPRLYMTFPIDFPDHPKVLPLSPLAKWTFVEMNSYSRRLGTDGVISVAVAHAKWVRKALNELVSSHPERPLVELVGDNYVIRDYAEHQETTASIAARRETNRANGAKGGRPSKSNRTETESVSGQNPDGTESKAESEIEIDTTTTDMTHPPASPAGSDARDPGIDKALIRLITEKEALAAERASQLGIRDIVDIRHLIEQACGLEMNLLAAVDVAAMILAKAKAPVENPAGYIARTCEQSPAMVYDLYLQLDLEKVPA